MSSSTPAPISSQKVSGRLTSDEGQVVGYSTARRVNDRDHLLGYRYAYLFRRHSGLPAALMKRRGYASNKTGDQQMTSAMLHEGTSTCGCVAGIALTTAIVVRSSSSDEWSVTASAVRPGRVKMAGLSSVCTLRVTEMKDNLANHATWSERVAELLTAG